MASLLLISKYNLAFAKRICSLIRTFGLFIHIIKHAIANLFVVNNFYINSVDIEFFIIIIIIINTALSLTERSSDVSCPARSCPDSWAHDITIGTSCRTMLGMTIDINYIYHVLHFIFDNFRWDRQYDCVVSGCSWMSE